ncbi:MAG: thiamine diphosphokinase [Ruminococcus sp.]|nr:thiamine diphosphokinase [Ruminococcus sp.]
MIGYIFGGADIDDYSKIEVVHGALVIAADSGYRHCKALGLTPDKIIGDFDSIDDAELPEDTGIEVIHASREKDDTDLLLAVRECLMEHCSDIRIYGGDGGRMGHTIANVQILRSIARFGCEGRIYGNGFEMVFATKGRHDFYDNGYRYVSILAMSNTADISVKGLKYEGHEGRISLSSDYPKGVSNEFIESSCSVEVINGEVLVIFEF